LVLIIVSNSKHNSFTKHVRFPGNWPDWWKNNHSVVFERRRYRVYIGVFLSVFYTFFPRFFRPPAHICSSPDWPIEHAFYIATFTVARRKTYVPGPRISDNILLLYCRLHVVYRIRNVIGCVQSRVYCIIYYSR